MSEDTDNKVEEVKDPDAPRMKHEVEEIIEREQAEEKPEEGVTPEPEPEPEVPEWQAEMDKMKAEYEKEIANIKSRYESSSEEGKRLAGELKRYKSRDEYLRSNYDLDPLLEGYEDPTPPEAQPITRGDLERWQVEQEWRGAESAFFSNPDNKDITENPMLRELTKRWIFDESGQYLRYPDKSPLESFSLAAREVRNAMAGERLRGKEEVVKTRTELERAGIVEGTGAKPEVSDNKEPEDTVSGEDSYVDLWKKNRRRIIGDM